jgi:alkanesulfonate monooxygenase SsuD/methylene tetrahydromethanopterin reductase-like flavin-dependent oxidoreductase (luciferase family)
VIGVLIRDPSVARSLELIEQAESLGVPAVWLTTTGAGRDGLTLLAAAAARTSLVRLGTAIIPTWPRHPVSVAQAALTIDALAPGRLRIGLGIASGANATMVGESFQQPLAALREYVVQLRALLAGEAVDTAGEHYTTHAQLERAVDVPVMASALRANAFRVCGQVAEGAISWMTPWPYIESAALPALRAGAEAAHRATPRLIFHAPVCVTPDGNAARAAATEQVGLYTRIPSWAAMFAAAGHDTSQGLTEAYLDEVLVHGDEAAVGNRLRSFISAGAAEVIVHPVTVGDRDQALHATLAAVAAANS